MTDATSATVVATQFPDARFRCPPRFADEHDRRVALGRAWMAVQTVVICGLARDVSSMLDLTTARLEQLGECFADYRVVIFENDSHDDTLPMLRVWQRQNPRVTVLTGAYNNHRWPQIPSAARASQMAHFRNQYVDHVRAYHLHFDYLIVVDTDLPEGFSVDGVANTFGHDEWDMVGANGIQIMRYGNEEQFPVQFDAWAFRDDQHPSVHSYDEVNPRVYRRGEPLVPVYSCFGGLAVYRMEIVRAGMRYAGGDCEHVQLHRRMRRYGFDRIFLNPSQIVLHPPP